MPDGDNVSLTYDFEDRVILVRAVGNYEPSDLKTTILEALDDARLPREPVLLFDLRDSRSIGERTADDVRDMARFLAAHGRRYGKRVAMVTTGDLAFGLMRLGSATAEIGGVAAEVFRDMESARAWLMD
jgi:hypothetical protein